MEEDPLGRVSTEVSRYPCGLAQTQDVCPWEGDGQVVESDVSIWKCQNADPESPWAEGWLSRATLILGGHLELSGQGLVEFNLLG